MAYGITNAIVSKGIRFTYTVGNTIYEYKKGIDLDETSIMTETNPSTGMVKCWLKESGTLSFSHLPKSEAVRAFAVGAGGNGTRGGYPYGEYQNVGAAGAGGYTDTTEFYTISKNQDMAIVVGSRSGDSSSTSGMGLTAAQGTDATSGAYRRTNGGTGYGGAGAHAFYDSTWGTGDHFYAGENGQDGVYAFGEDNFDGIKYGAGGGGGNDYGFSTYSGGATGGGASGTNGTANTGGGGGGGGTSIGYAAGTGGSGVFIFETLVVAI